MRQLINLFLLTGSNYIEPVFFTFNKKGGIYLLREFQEAGQTVVSNLILDYYQKIGMNNEEFIIWLQLYRYVQEGNRFPDASIIAEKLNLPLNSVFSTINNLIQKELILITQKEDATGKKTDCYDFSPIYDRIEQLITQSSKQNEKNSTQMKVKELFQHFEEEFGRTLSSIEYQRINQWLQEDHYSVDLIYLALKEAVINQAYSLNYIDRILLSWERKNITSPQQVKEEQNKRKQKFTSNGQTTNHKSPKSKITMYNWLEGK